MIIIIIIIIIITTVPLTNVDVAVAFTVVWVDEHGVPCLSAQWNAIISRHCLQFNTQSC